MAARNPDPVLALDFGGTKLAMAVVDFIQGEIFAQVVSPTPANQGAEASLEAIITAGKEALSNSTVSQRKIRAVGISFGGPVSQDRRTVLRSMHVADWEFFDLPARIESIFDCPAFLDNDANAAALGEWQFGAGRGFSDLAYIQVSTGVGAGLILNNQVYRGLGLAGEFGHLTVLEHGPACTCGKYGCLESLCSGWAIAREGRALLASGTKSDLDNLCGGKPENLTAEIVLQACQTGDPAACALVEQAFRYLAIGIANLIKLVDPQSVVLGGGLTRSQQVMHNTLARHLPEYLPPMFSERTQLDFSQLQGRETLLGAALLTQGF